MNFNFAFVMVVAAAFAQAEIPAAHLKKLQAAYNRADVLILGHNNHMTDTSSRYLRALLASVGNDPRLKTIALERLTEADELLQQASQTALEQILLQPLTDAGQREIVCQASSQFSAEEEEAHGAIAEWTYDFVTLAPLIRNLNSSRSSPVMLRAMDGMTLVHDVAAYDPKEQVLGGDCANPHAYPMFASSRDREEASAEKFLRLLAELRPGEKMIVLYHYWHVIPGLRGCLPEWHDTAWRTMLGDANWLEIALKRNTELRDRTRIVVLDEKSPWDPEGITHAGADGLEFRPNAFVNTYLGGLETQSPSQIFDDVIQVPATLPQPFLSPSRALPAFCAPKAPTF